MQGSRGSLFQPMEHPHHVASQGNLQQDPSTESQDQNGQEASDGTHYQVPILENQISIGQGHLTPFKLQEYSADPHLILAPRFKLNGKNASRRLYGQRKKPILNRGAFNVFIPKPRKASKKRNRVRRPQTGRNSTLAAPYKGKDITLSNLLSKAEILKEDIIQELNASKDSPLQGPEASKESSKIIFQRSLCMDFEVPNVTPFRDSPMKQNHIDLSLESPSPFMDSPTLQTPCFDLNLD